VYVYLIDSRNSVVMSCICKVLTAPTCAIVHRANVSGLVGVVTMSAYVIPGRVVLCINFYLSVACPMPIYIVVHLKSDLASCRQRLYCSCWLHFIGLHTFDARVKILHNIGRE